MGDRDINDVLRNEGVDAARAMHDGARPFETDGAAILNDVRAFLSRFIAYPSEHAKTAHVLWAAHTHLMGAWESTPRIAFLSPEPGSGKTRAMEVTELVVPNPVCAVNVTPAYLFRKVGDEEGPPTILFDEIDTVFGPKAKENEEIRALLNSGHRRGAVAGRCVVQGKIVKTEEIPSFAAVALAGLGWLPDTILSRSIVVRMRRRAPDEGIEPFRRRLHAPHGEALRRRLTAWSEAVLQEATEARPEMPAGVEDRDADVWEPLLAVAGLAGGDWPRLAREAARAMVNAARESEPSLNIRLLADLRTIFESKEHKNAGHLSTKMVLAGLCSLESAPWNDLKGKPITDNQLARRLGQYGVKSKTLRLEHNIFAKGYAREDLHDVWRRYLPPPSDEPVTAVTSVTAQSFQDVGEEGEMSRACAEPSQPSQNFRDMAAVTGWITSCDALVAPGNLQKMLVVADVTSVTPSAGNKRAPRLDREPVDAGDLVSHGALDSNEPKRDGALDPPPEGENSVASRFTGFSACRDGGQPKQVRTIL
jgi:hypothetical protein